MRLKRNSSSGNVEQVQADLAVVGYQFLLGLAAVFAEEIGEFGLV